MKQFFLLAIFIIGISFSVSAQEIEVDGIRYSLLGEGKLKVIGGTGNGKLNIPDSVKYRGRTFVPTVIGKGAFLNSDISSVFLPSTLRVIEERAFMNTSISEINFPVDLYWIAKEAFENTQLDSVFLPKTLAEHPHWRDTGVGEFAFRGCKKLRVVEFDTEGCAAGPGTGWSEKKPIRVYAGAFDDCDNIEKIIYNGEPPIFDPYINGYKSRTFSKIVLEFATLYCPAWWIDKGRRFVADYAMEGFATVKPIPETVKIFENIQWEKELKETINNILSKAKEHGSIGYTQGYFVCGIKPFLGSKGDPNVQSIESNGDSTIIAFDKKKNQTISLQFNEIVKSVNTIKRDDYDYIVVDAICSTNADVVIFKCTRTYSNYYRNGKDTEYCLWYGDKIYRIDNKYYEQIESLFSTLE